MITIIEGPDGSGKTTLAKYIASTTGATILHFGKPVDAAEHASQLEDYRSIMSHQDNIVLDRSWLSDIVYADIFKDREWRTTVEQANELLELGNGRAIVIFCNSDIETLWQRCQERGEEYVTDFSLLLQVRTSYMDIMKIVPAHLPLLHYEFK